MTSRRRKNEHPEAQALSSRSRGDRDDRDRQLISIVAGSSISSLIAHEEQHRLLPIDDAVIVRQRDVHHRPDLDLAVDRDRAILNLVQPEDARPADS